MNVADKELDESPDEALILKAVSLRRSFSIGSAEVSVLRGLSLDIKRNEKLFLRGASGAGKSTLLYTLAGLERPDSGSVIIDGKSLYDLSATEQTIFRNKKIGYVFQNYFLMPDLNALENVMIPSMIKGKNDDIERAVELLEKVGLGERLNHRPSELSGGEQQRVAIARALINDPEIIFADEPTGNLDAKNSKTFIELIKKLNKKMNQTFVIVTHNKEFIKISDKSYTIQKGKLN